MRNLKIFGLMLVVGVVVITTAYLYLHYSGGEKIAVEKQHLFNISIAISTDISTIDIHFAKGVADFEVLGKVYEALFKIISKPNGELDYIPWLAKNYTILNETTWLFVLRDDVYFHNGKKLDAWDVKASLERSMRISPIGRMLLTDAQGNPIIREVVVLNSTSFILKLSKPFTPLIEHLAHLSTAIIPKEVAEKYWDTPVNSSVDIIGTGPFRFTHYEKGSKVILKRFDGYWGRAPGISTLTYLVLPDASARVSALATGEAQIAVGISPDMVKPLKEKGFVIHNVSGVRLVLVAINCERIPNINVRQALNYAVDKKVIVEKLLNGFAEIATSVASPVFPGVYKFEPYQYNVTKSLELLRKSGFINKTLRLLVSTRSPKDIQLAQVVQEYLSKVGVNVVIEQLEHTVFLKKVFTDHDFDLAIYGPSPSSLYYALTYWRTGAALNGPQYSNHLYDELLDRIASELDESRRLELLREAQAILWNDAPAIWLYFERIIVASRPEVKGLQILPFQMLVLDDIYIG